jgi:hypothetical protein
MKQRWKSIALLVTALVVATVVVVRREKPREPDRPTIVAQVQRLNELATVRFTVQRIVDLEERATPVGAERILLIVQAHLRAGVDLAALRPEDVQVEDGRVTLRLPPAKLLDAAIDDGATRVWDRQKTWWTPWVPYSKDLEQRARLQGLEAARKAAIDMEILRQAERNAAESIRGLLGLAGIGDVRVLRAGDS